MVLGGSAALRFAAMHARSLCALPLIALLASGCLPDDPIGNAPLETTTVTLTDLGAGPQSIDLADGLVTGEWDLQADGWNLFLNGGESGDGKAGGIDMELLDLELPFEEMNRRNQLVWFLFFDSYACALSDWWWYALDGTHTLFSDFHVYIAQRGDRHFAVQILDYYRVIDGTAAAGYPEFRWAEIPTDGADPVITVEDLDATAGGLSADADDPSNQWTYFSFDAGVLDLTDAESLASSDWDLGFKRFNMKSNSGPSGPGGVLTVDPDRERGETAEEVLAYTPEGQLGYFEQRIDAFDPLDDHPFVEDAVQPVVRRWHRGLPGSAAEPVSLWEGRWFLVTDRTGGEVAKLRVTDFSGSDAAGPDSLTLEWAILP